jgi:hypothetical protein
MCVDTKTAIRFYTQLFGWKTREVDMGPGGPYTMIANGDRDIGGVVAAKASDGHPSRWLGYVATDEVDATTKKVESLGGKVAVPPTDIPGVGRFAVLQDPVGAVIALFRSAQL